MNFICCYIWITYKQVNNKTIKCQIILEKYAPEYCVCSEYVQRSASVFNRTSSSDCSNKINIKTKFTLNTL